MDNNEMDKNFCQLPSFMKKCIFDDTMKKKSLQWALNKESPSYTADEKFQLNDREKRKKVQIIWDQADHDENYEKGDKANVAHFRCCRNSKEFETRLAELSSVGQIILRKLK